MKDRVPPHDLPCEKGALGCILDAGRECLARCQEVLTDGATEFYDGRNAEIYAVMCGMTQPINIVTVRTALKESVAIDYLATLQDSAITPLNIDYWLEGIHQAYLLRKLIQTCREVALKAYQCPHEQAMAVIDQAEAAVLAVRPKQSGGEKTTRELVQESLADMEHKVSSKGALTGLSTGFIDLDQLTDGLHPGEMTTLAAYPGVGKTALAMNIAEHMVLSSGLPAGVFSLEMTSRQLVTRTICSHARVNLRNLSKGYLTEADFPKITVAAGKLSKAAIYFDDTSGMSIFQLRAKARRWHQRYGIKFLVIDYLQLLSAVGGSRAIENRQQEVADISRGIKEMSKELNIPVLALSQLNDDGKLRESRAIGQDSDNLLELKENGELWIRKQRNGPKNVKVNLVFLPQFTRFENAAKEHHEYDTD